VIEYEASVGMEVHAELLTRSKMFCGCRNAFGGGPNTRCCPVCLGLPGALPVINRAAVHHVIRAALALNCSIARIAHFDRKNYLYPDLPKGYQISQYDNPIGRNGWLDIRVDGTTRRVHIRRVHLEEDTGKLSHLASGDSAVDYNRSGVPLMEIVTEFPPDMRTAAEARAYLVALRAILTYIGVSDGKMEQGSLRCEPNVSVRVAGSPAYGTKTEIKNLNSFRAVQRGIEFELARQIAVLRSGCAVRQETRGWSEESQATVSQRSKEEEQEYRYFPDPDLVPVEIGPEWVRAVRADMPELPEQARTRLMEAHGLSEYEATWIIEDRRVAAFFTDCVAVGAPAAKVAAWMMGEFARLLNASGAGMEGARVTPQGLAELIRLVDDGQISGPMAKSFFERMYENGDAPADLLRLEGGQIQDLEEVAGIISRVIEAEPAVWDALRRGDERKLTYLMGQVMKASRGKANPHEARRLIAERLEGSR
jgi:aspartyl-tRNA(Asn)/glutamyl-tRNA(Gln) amidotransferase subunit B